MMTADPRLMQAVANASDANVGRAETISGLIASIRILADTIAKTAETHAIAEHAADLAEELRCIERDVVQPLLSLAKEAANTAQGRVEAAYANAPSRA
jgi:hypothetical protein